jgi:hypothetical protein
MIYGTAVKKLNRAAGGMSQAQGLADQFPPISLWSHTEQRVIVFDNRPNIEYLINRWHEDQHVVTMVFDDPTVWASAQRVKRAP